MKIKKNVKFNLLNLYKPVLIYYAILITTGVVFLLISLLSEGDTRMGSFEFATITFLFIYGLNSFKAPFYLSLQNGISRKTMFYSYLLTSVILSAFMALIESVVYSFIGKSSTFQSGFYQCFSNAYSNQLIEILVSFAWSFALYFTACVVGYFITTLYYRMSKTLKLVVSIGVPSLILFIIPAIDSIILHGELSRAVARLFNYVMESFEIGVYPFIYMLICIIISGVLILFSYMLTKRAVVKKD